MVAYSFQKRFVGRLLAGLEPGPWRPGMKRQTLRPPRRNNRHAYPGQQVQLYSGARTRQCRLIGRAVCLVHAPVALIWGDGRFGLRLRTGTVHVPTGRDDDLPPEILRLVLGDELWGAAMEFFAQADGFADAAEMSRFFDAPPTPLQSSHQLRLTLIGWAPEAREP
jgi:hypothetical protein